VENDEHLLNFFRRSLTDEGYAVRTAADSEEALRLYHDCAPFNVVLIDYYVPQKNGSGIDCLVPQTHGIGLARAIREINLSQGIIIAALDYQTAQEVTRPRELMHIPLLIDISNFQLRGLLEKIEVDRMLEMLTTAELLKLQRFADFRVRGLGRAADGRTGKDLLGEAVVRTLTGAEDTQKGRHWNKNVDFVQHLAGAIRSISNCWKRHCKEEVYLVSELVIHDVEGQEYSPLDNLASEQVAADQCLIEKDEESRVLATFKDDSDATHVLQGLLNGLKKHEIMLRYGLGEKQYAAVVKRIRVKLMGLKSGGTRGEKHGR